MKRNIHLLISEEFAEKIIPQNDSVRLAEKLIEEMDLSCLYNTYSHKGRKYLKQLVNDGIIYYNVYSRLYSL